LLEGFRYFWVGNSEKKKKKVNTCGELYSFASACGGFVEASFFLGKGDLKLRKKTINIV